MSLREQAELDLGVILEGDACGFRWSVIVTDPGGVSAPLYGFSNDISQTVDPETGVLVSGQLASVALRISSLTAAGFTSLPEGVESRDSLPWVITFADINGNTCAFKVRQSDPDRALGMLVCTLEAYTP